MFGRVKDAVTDAAETLRRAFAGLRVGELRPEPFRPQAQGSSPLAVDSVAGLQPPATTCQDMRLLEQAVAGRALEPFQATLCDESGWARWGAEADVLHMTPLEAARTTRMAVPPLPRKAQVLGKLEPPLPPATRRWAEPLTPPGVRLMEAGLRSTESMAGLRSMLTLPVPIKSEDIQRLPKGMWMRYSLQLVRGTGENVRNLEVLGLFFIPRKGVADLRHDPGQRRILLRLEPLAVKAARAPFILARRKDDGDLVSCYVEDP